jgi:O-antigen/teichoic acid export membrane protein
LVPLTIHFLGAENYGVWLILSSFVAWFTFFDIGLGNGLRNKFAEARTTNDIELAKGYVSTAYFTIGLICIGFLCISLLVSLNVNWTVLFNTSEQLHSQLQILMPVVLGGFGLQLIAKLITSIYTGDQNHSIQGKINFITSFSSLFIIWVLTKTTQSSLLLFGTLFSLLPVLILLVLNLYAFTNRFKEFRPQRSYWKKKYFKDIFGLGLTFFAIQLSGIILFSTDNLIITQLFSPEEVVPYNLAFKYIGISLMVYSIVLTPYWSSITEALTKGELDWIKTSIKNLNKFSIITVFGIIIMVLIAPFIYKFWLGELVTIPYFLTVCMALYFMLSVVSYPFTSFINGAGKVKLQMYTLVVTAVINIPLSIFFVKYTSMGVEGVILATIICILPHVILCPIQYYKLINNKADGIWNK